MLALNKQLKRRAGKENKNYIESKPMFSEHCETHHEHMETINTRLSPFRIFVPRSRADTCKHTFLILVDDRGWVHIFLFLYKDRLQPQ